MENEKVVFLNDIPMYISTHGKDYRVNKITYQSSRAVFICNDATFYSDGVIFDYIDTPIPKQLGDFKQTFTGRIKSDPNDISDDCLWKDHTISLKMITEHDPNNTSYLLYTMDPLMSDMITNITCLEYFPYISFDIPISRVVVEDIKLDENGYPIYHFNGNLRDAAVLYNFLYHIMIDDFSINEDDNEIDVDMRICNMIKDALFFAGFDFVSEYDPDWSVSKTFSNLLYKIPIIMDYLNKVLYNPSSFGLGNVTTSYLAPISSLNLELQKVNSKDKIVERAAITGIVDLFDGDEKLLYPKNLSKNSNISEIVQINWWDKEDARIPIKNNEYYYRIQETSMTDKIIKNLHDDSVIAKMYAFEILDKMKERNSDGSITNTDRKHRKCIISEFTYNRINELLDKMKSVFED